MNPRDFWELTFAEYHMMCEGYFRKQENQWEHTRYIGCLLLNLHRKKGSPPIKPEDLVPLSIDKKRKKQKAKDLHVYSQEEIDRLKTIWK